MNLPIRSRSIDSSVNIIGNRNVLRLSYRNKKVLFKKDFDMFAVVIVKDIDDLTDFTGV